MRRCISDNVVKTRISFTLTPRFKLDLEKMKQNYLQRYPFILDERYANVCNIIEHSYNINGKNDNKSPECISNVRNVVVGMDQSNKTTEEFTKRPLLLMTNINCAPRKSSPVSMATALAISYRKGTKSRSGSSGPTRYKIENQFQSRFCR